MQRCKIGFESNYAKVDGKEITVTDYLAGKYPNASPTCIPGNHKLHIYHSKQRRSHFRHRYNRDLEGYPMTEWHREWQSNFPDTDTEIEFQHNVNQLKNRRADIVIPKYKKIIEIQHSSIESGEVIQRNKDYGAHGHSVTWVIDGQKCIKVKPLDKRLVLEFQSPYWLYQSFLSCEEVFYDIDGFIYKVNPSLVHSYQIDVSEPVPKGEFIESLKDGTNPWVTDEPPQCFLHLRQEGAGSGKTYGMMQKLNNDPEISNYKYIALITKQHSAVKVMLQEFDDQYYGTGSHKEKLLTNLDGLEKGVSNSGKQRIRKYTNTRTGIECIAVFGTVDSFTYALTDGESSKNVSDKFAGILQLIRDGTIKTAYAGRMKYAGVNPILNKEMLIMIDETQDLTEEYGDAFLQVVRSKYANLCVVGDTLQSLSFKDNSLTYLHRAEGLHMKVIKAEKANLVRRFSDPTLVKFVNDLIPFEKYGLPNMTPAKGRAADPASLTVFQGKTVYASAAEDNDILQSAVAEVVALFEKEVATNNRVPEDFLIVTPFTKKNPLMEALQIAINAFWKDMMEKGEYIERVKGVHPYWKDIDTKVYRRYAIFHKSEDGCSIDTNESIHSTRMVSIHSSKGDGRKVVFVIGVTESALKLISQGSINLIYDSLLHVAITRQKERLYFRLEANNDDIHGRIKRAETDIAMGSTDFDVLKKRIKMSKVVEKIVQDAPCFESLFTMIISKKDPVLPEETTNKKLIIDMGNHTIRYGSMFMNIVIHCCNHATAVPSDTKKQFLAILHGIKDAQIHPVTEWKKYYKTLQNNKKKDSTSAKYIPVLEFTSRRDNQDYAGYFNIIVAVMQRVQQELKSLGKKSINYLCPFESVLLYYMIECTQKGVFQSVTISDLYNIIDIYSKVFDPSALGHDACHCKKHFPGRTLPLTELEKEYQEYLCGHYDRLAHVNRLLDAFDKKYPAINWLYSHPIGIDRAKQFFLFTEKSIIGYDDNRVYNVYIKPQFTELNFNEFLLESLLDTYILCNQTETNNLTRFGNKQVVSYVISLNKEEIYEIDWTEILFENAGENAKRIRDILYSKLYTIFSTKHQQYYEAFINTLAEEEKINPRKIIETCEEKYTGEKWPEYLRKAWASISTKVEECETHEERMDILEEYKRNGKFLHLFNLKLSFSLKRFLDIDEEFC